MPLRLEINTYFHMKKCTIGRSEFIFISHHLSDENTHFGLIHQHYQTYRYKKMLERKKTGNKDTRIENRLRNLFAVAGSEIIRKTRPVV